MEDYHKYRPPYGKHPPEEKVEDFLKRPIRPYLKHRPPFGKHHPLENVEDEVPTTEELGVEDKQESKGQKKQPPYKKPPS